MAQDGEVETRVNNLRDEIFEKYGKTDDKGQKVIYEDDLKTFIKEIMTDAGELDAWDD